MVFRSINDRIGELNVALEGGPMIVLCECNSVHCAEPIELDTATYTRVRANPAQFVVLPGHEVPQLDHVVERHPAFCVTRSSGD